MKMNTVFMFLENSSNTPGISNLQDIFQEFYNGPGKTPGILYDPIA